MIKFVKIFAFLLIATNALAQTTSYNVTYTIKNNNGLIKDARVNLEGYGEQISDSTGKAIFQNVAPENLIEYTVSAYNYENYNDRISVIDEDLDLEINLIEKTYQVKFIIKAGDEFYDGATVTLGNYGTKSSDDDGKVKFTDVLPSDSIYYEVNAKNISTKTGKITITDENISKEINLLTIGYKVTFEVLLGSDPVNGAEVTFHEYGSKITNNKGLAVFDSVLPGSGLNYTVKMDGYSNYVSGIDVFNQDVFEQIIYSKPSYNVLFIVSAHGQPLANANITLSTYGTQTTDNFGYARFINVDQGIDISYTISANEFPDWEGSVSVFDRDVEEIISLTDIEYIENTFLNVWPNPTNDFINISTKQKGTVQIINLNGEIIYSFEESNNPNKISLCSLGKGVYLVRFISEEYIKTEKIIVD